MKNQFRRGKSKSDSEEKTSDHRMIKYNYSLFQNNRRVYSRAAVARVFALTRRSTSVVLWIGWLVMVLFYLGAKHAIGPMTGYPRDSATSERKCIGQVERRAAAGSIFQRSAM